MMATFLKSSLIKAVFPYLSFFFFSQKFITIYYITFFAPRKRTRFNNLFQRFYGSLGDFLQQKSGGVLNKVAALGARGGLLSCKKEKQALLPLGFEI